MGYLDLALKSLCDEFPGTRSMGVLADHRGAYAHSIIGPSGRAAYFCAKDSLGRDNIVSCHEQLVSLAVQYAHPIIMCVQGEMYKFDGRDIARYRKFKNHHNGAAMLNFSLNLGTLISQPPHRESTGQPTNDSDHRSRSESREVSAGV